MAMVLLVRHGRTPANASGILAGRTPGVELDEVGLAQAARTADRLASVPLAEVVSSPLERCRQTASLILAAQEVVPPETIDDAVTECDYGDWQGRPLAELAREPLWPVVQRQPSAAVFPGGESLAAMQARAVASIRGRDAAITRQFGASAVWAVVSHADIIKAVLADALGMHLDQFQRIFVGPASVSVVRFGDEGPDVLATNTDSGDLSWLRS
ncbi:MAG TPA: histidine phosphatase family protein [Galbitalea sp.]|jgi:probable phosphomutase (TIGR03848 family)